MDITKRVSKRWSCALVPQSQPSQSLPENGHPVRPANKRWSTSLGFLWSGISDEPRHHPNAHEPLSSRRNRVSCTFPLGPDSRVSLAEPRAKKPSNVVEARWENIPLHHRINAAIRVAETRAQFVPHSIEYRALAGRMLCEEEANVKDMRRDSMTENNNSRILPASDVESNGDEDMLDIRQNMEHELPSLKEDILWLSLVYLPRATTAGACTVCNKEIGYPKASSWRLHGCGHRYHSSCFRSLSWLYPTSATSDNSTDYHNLEGTEETKCSRCDNFRRQCCKVGIRGMRARIERLEVLLCPHKAKLHCPSFKGRGRATMEACERQIAEESARSQSYPPLSPWSLDDQSPQISNKPMVLSPASTFKLDTKDTRPDTWPPKDTKNTSGPPTRPIPVPAPKNLTHRAKPPVPSPLHSTKRAQAETPAHQQPHLTTSPVEDRLMSVLSTQPVPSMPSASSSTVHPSTSLPTSPSRHDPRGNRTHVPTSVHVAAAARQADIETAKQKQKRTWRESVPAGTDIKALESVYKLNPGHAIFKRIEELNKEEEKKGTYDQKERQGWK